MKQNWGRPRRWPSRSPVDWFLLLHLRNYNKTYSSSFLLSKICLHLTKRLKQNKLELSPRCEITISTISTMILSVTWLSNHSSVWLTLALALLFQRCTLAMHPSMISTCLSSCSCSITVPRTLTRARETRGASNRRASQMSSKELWCLSKLKLHSMIFYAWWVILSPKESRQQLKLKTEIKAWWKSQWARTGWCSVRGLPSIGMCWSSKALLLSPARCFAATSSANPCQRTWWPDCQN